MKCCEFGDGFSSGGLGDLLSYLLIFPISYGKSCQIQTLSYWTQIQVTKKMTRCEYGDGFSSGWLGDLLSYILMFPISYGKACQIQMI